VGDCTPKPGCAASRLRKTTRRRHGLAPAATGAITHDATALLASGAAIG